MTDPVYAYHQGLMTKKGVAATTADEIRNLVLGACGTCDTFQFIVNTIKPVKEPRGFDIDITKYDAVIAGTIDGAIGDLPVILSKVATPKYSKPSQPASSSARSRLPGSCRRIRRSPTR